MGESATRIPGRLQMGKDGASGDMHPFGFSQKHQSLRVNGEGASPVLQLNTLLLFDLGQVTQPLWSLASLWCLLLFHLLGMIMSLSVRVLPDRVGSGRKCLPQSMSSLSKEAEREW